MVNDIKKLDEVIGVIEEQAHHLKELNGVLDALNEAREGIEKSNIRIGVLSEKQESIVTENSQNFKGFDDKLTQLENKLTVVDSSQNQSQKETLELNKQLGELKEIQVNIQKVVSDLEFLTPEAFYYGRVELETKLDEKIKALNDIVGEVALQQSKVWSLQVVTIVVMFLLAGGVGYFN